MLLRRIPGRGECSGEIDISSLGVVERCRIVSRGSVVTRTCNVENLSHVKGFGGLEVVVLCLYVAF